LEVYRFLANGLANPSAQEKSDAFEQVRWHTILGLFNFRLTPSCFDGAERDPTYFGFYRKNSLPRIID
jgi:hypothetical protein